MDARTIIGIVGIISVTALQIAAWSMGHDGAVFALTSVIIGGVTGYFFGWKRNIKQKIREYVDEIHKNEIRKID